VLPGPGAPGEGCQAAEEELLLQEHLLLGHHQRPPHRPRQAFDKATKIIKRKPGRRSSLIFLTEERVSYSLCNIPATYTVKKG